MPLLPVAKSGSKFLSTLPARGATFWISVRSLKAWPFLSTLPARGATDGLLAEGDRGHISIHAPREGSDRFSSKGAGSTGISIHAPREGSDWAPTQNKASCMISIHAPREGSDGAVGLSQTAFKKFLSTLPVRGATPG